MAVKKKNAIKTMSPKGPSADPASPGKQRVKMKTPHMSSAGAKLHLKEGAKADRKMGGHSKVGRGHMTKKGPKIKKKVKI
jgi:hypothetical protein